MEVMDVCVCVFLICVFIYFSVYAFTCMCVCVCVCAWGTGAVGNHMTRRSGSTEPVRPHLVSVVSVTLPQGNSSYCVHGP